jgi:hypothetical protein
MSKESHERLLAILRGAVEQAQQSELSLGELADQLKDASFYFLGILVCLPFLFPVTILGPLTIPGGLAIVGIGWQMWRGAEKLTLPARFARVKLGATAWSALLGVCQRLLSITARFAKPRLQHWTEGKRGEYWAGLLVMISGALLAIPMGGVVPLNNTLPALCGVCACVALLENDGLWFAVSVFWLILTLIYFALIAYFVFYAGAELKAWMTAHLPSWL